MSEQVRVWVDGALVDASGPSISALDHAVTVGDGVFETCKVLDGEVFALGRHLARLDRSLAGMGLPPADHQLIQSGIDAVLDVRPLDVGPLAFGRLRFTVTGGVGPPGSDRSGAALTYIVTAAPTAKPPSSTALVVVPFVRNERAATAGLKTTSYADNVVALAYAQARGAGEAVFANTRGDLSECTGSNIFVVVDGEVRTPRLSDGPLGGITRALVLQWCREEGLPVREATLPMAVLDQAEEVFITSSTRDVLGIHAVDGRSLAAPGPVTTEVAALFARRAAETSEP